MLKNNNKNTSNFLHRCLCALVQIPAQIFRSHRGAFAISQLSPSAREDYVELRVASLDEVHSTNNNI